MPESTTRYVLFPEFTRKKLSIRICNSKDDDKIPYIYNSVHLRQSLNSDRSYTWVYIDKARKAFVLSNKPPLGRDVRGQFFTDLRGVRNDTLEQVFEAAGLEQGITYFGQETVDGGTSKVFYKLPDFERIMAENEETLRSFGIPILEE